MPARALGARPRHRKGERDRRRRAAAQGLRDAARRARAALALHARRRRAGAPVGTWATQVLELARVAREGRLHRVPVRAVEEGRPAREACSASSPGDDGMARYPAALDPKDDGAVSVEELDALPVAEKTPWSFDATRQSGRVTALVEVSAAGAVARVLPTGDAEPLLVRWLRESAAKWRLAPARAGGKPVACVDDARRDARLHDRLGEEEGRAHREEEPARVRVLSTFRRSPTRRVSFFESKYSRSGMSVLRVRPRRSRKPATRERLALHALELLLGRRARRRGGRRGRARGARGGPTSRGATRGRPRPAASSREPSRRRSPSAARSPPSGRAPRASPRTTPRRRRGRPPSRRAGRRGRPRARSSFRPRASRASRPRRPGEIPFASRARNSPFPSASGAAPAFRRSAKSAAARAARSDATEACAKSAGVIFSARPGRGERLEEVRGRRGHDAEARAEARGREARRAPPRGGRGPRAPSRRPRRGRRRATPPPRCGASVGAAPCRGRARRPASRPGTDGAG